MSNTIPAHIRNETVKPSSDKLDAIRAKARQARDLEFQIKNLEEQVKEHKIQLYDIYSNQLPDLMLGAGVDTIGLPQEGNYLGWDYNLETFYRANIAAKWPNEKREAAFDYIKSMGAEDLIKTEVVVYFPKGGVKLAQKLLSQVKKIKMKPPKGKKVAPKIRAELSRSIPHGSLSAWLKELVEKRHKVPSASDLEKIGGAIGRIVKPEERKE